MISFEKWYEKAEDKLLEEYEAKKSPINWDEFVLGKFEDYEYEKFKDEK